MAASEPHYAVACGGVSAVSIRRACTCMRSLKDSDWNVKVKLSQNDSSPLAIV